MDELLERTDHNQIINLTSYQGQHMREAICIIYFLASTNAFIASYSKENSLNRRSLKLHPACN